MNVFSEKVSVFRTCYETTPFSTVLLKDWLQTKLYEKVICALRHLDRAPELQIQDREAVIPCEQRTTIRYQVSEMSAF